MTVAMPVETRVYTEVYPLPAEYSRAKYAQYMNLVSRFMTCLVLS